MLLIKNIDLYTPKHMGIRDVLVAGGKIVDIAENIDVFSAHIQVVDGLGKKCFPGFIDQHVHITGGGGEGSFRTRVPEITLSKLTTAGITTVVGLLGTDASTRTVESLVAKAKALKEEGLSAYAMTGAYSYPPVTLTGDVKKDIVYVEEIIGGKLAISDHRSSNITTNELIHMASDVRVAGMLSGKSGTLTLHIGDGQEGLVPVFDALEKSNIPVKTIRPTHVNRKEKLMYQSFDYAKMGGMIDMTCGINKNWTPAKAILKSIELDVPQENITISSDGYGSFSDYDEKGVLLKIGVSTLNIYEEFKCLVEDYNFSIEDALIYVTENVAKGLSLYPSKGCIGIDSDGDLLIVDETLTIDTVVALGKIMVKDKKNICYGTYE